MKECRPFVPCRSRSALPEPALRSPGYCAARVHGGGWGTMHITKHIHTNKHLKAGLEKKET